MDEQALFALLSVLIVMGVINYSMIEGCKYFKQSIKKLSKELFNYEADNLYIFIDTLKERVYQIDQDALGVGINNIFLDALNLNSE